MTIRQVLASPWLTIRVQLALGALFVAAALPKIIDPPSFAHMIYNYRILPSNLINISSLVMPWLELVCGLALIIGVWRKPALASSSIHFSTSASGLRSWRRAISAAVRSRTRARTPAC